MSQDLEPPEKRRRLSTTTRIPASNQSVDVDHDAPETSQELPQKPGLSTVNLQTEFAAPSAIEATHDEPDLITVNVKTLSGMLPPIAISAAATVRDLKLRVQTLNADFGFDRQKLLINAPENEGAGVVLLNHRTLDSYQITGSTNVMLVMVPTPAVQVRIDDDLKNSDRFKAMLGNPDLRATSISVSSIDSHRSFLLKLFEVNRDIQHIKISGQWTDEHLRFCESLLTLRPDVDIRFVVKGCTDIDVKTRLCVVEFCKLNRCSSIELSAAYLCDEGCRALTRALRAMPWLQNLALIHFKIFPVALGHALRSMSSLQTLKFAFDRIGVLECTALTSALQSLASMLQSMSSLHSLDLSGNEIGDACCVALAPALQSMSSLLTLKLSNNRIGAEGCRVLAPALQSLSFLKYLDLSYNSIGVAGSRALAPALQSKLSLQHLYLSVNPLGDACCVALAPALQSMSSLQTLDLSSCQICVSGSAALGRALFSMSSLLTLNLSNNDGIGASGCVTLATALQSMSSLQHLYLSSIHIGTEGCRALASALQSMSSLRTLNLRCSQIGDEGFVALAPALQSMLSLQSLDLGFNRIGAEGCGVALATALQSISSLHYLNLSGNWFGAEGCRALAPALQSMSSLHTLYLSDNKLQIGDDECCLLVLALQSMPSMKLVDLSYSRFDDAVLSKFRTALPSLEIRSER